MFRANFSGCVPASLVFWLVAMIFGVVFTALSYGEIQDYRASDTWEQTNGEILGARVLISTDSDGTSYRPEVTYSYVVNDQRYQNDRLRFDGSIYNSDPSGAEETIRAYELGGQVTVYYNPDDPQDAVIERDLTTEVQVFFGIGVGALILSCGLTIFLLFSGAAVVLAFLRG